MSLLNVLSISKRGEGNFCLTEINFSQRRLQKIAIVGETGSGKSTVLRIIAGLVQADSGEVCFEDKNIEGPKVKLVPGHPGIAYLSQHFELPKSLRVEQVLTYSNLLSEEEANTVYEVCEISHLLKRRTDELSGGERQRIALTKLLISKPRLLLLDEPFTNLDMVHKNILKAVIQDICDRLRITCILVSHDPEDILSWADKILVMKDGQILQKGSPEKIYKQPLNTYIAGLFGKYNLISSAEANVFSKLLKTKPTRKSMFIRPENFKLVAKGRKGISGKVTYVNFLGSYYEIGVAISETTIIIKTQTTTIKAGDTVYVSLDVADVRFM